jgi:hypothetical protein
MTGRLLSVDVSSSSSLSSSSLLRLLVTGLDVVANLRDGLDDFEGKTAKLMAEDDDDDDDDDDVVAGGVGGEGDSCNKVDAEAGEEDENDVDGAAAVVEVEVEVLPEVIRDSEAADNDKPANLLLEAEGANKDDDDVCLVE